MYSVCSDVMCVGFSCSVCSSSLRILFCLDIFLNVISIMCKMFLFIVFLLWIVMVMFNVFCLFVIVFVCYSVRVFSVCVSWKCGCFLSVLLSDFNVCVGFLWFRVLYVGLSLCCEFFGLSCMVCVECCVCVGWWMSVGVCCVGV